MEPELPPVLRKGAAALSAADIAFIRAQKRPDGKGVSRLAKHYKVGPRRIYSIWNDEPQAVPLAPLPDRPEYKAAVPAKKAKKAKKAHARRDTLEDFVDGVLNGTPPPIATGHRAHR